MAELGLGGDTLAEAWVRVGADLKPLSSGFARAKTITEGSARSLGMTFSRIAQPFFLGIAAVGTGLGLLAMSAGKFAEQMHNLSASSGLTTTQLQKLRYVTAVVGVDFEAFIKSTVWFQRRLMSVEQGTGLAAKVFKDLHMRIYDTNHQLRPMSEMFPEVISRLQQMANHTQRNAYATQLFGRSLQAMAPILNMTPKLLAEYMKQAPTLTQRQIDQAVLFDRQMNALKVTFQALGYQIGGAFMPALRPLTEFIEGTVIPAIKIFARDMKFLLEHFEKLPPWVKKGTVDLLAFGAAITVVNKAIQTMLMLTGAKWLGGKLFGGAAGGAAAGAAGGIGGGVAEGAGIAGGAAAVSWTSRALGVLKPAGAVVGAQLIRAGLIRGALMAAGEGAAAVGTGATLGWGAGKTAEWEDRQRGMKRYMWDWIPLVGIAHAARSAVLALQPQSYGVNDPRIADAVKERLKEIASNTRNGVPARYQ